MGIRRGDDHGGKACVVIGDKVVFKTIEESSPSQTSPEAPEPRKSEGKAVSGPARVEGVTVGMAINKAVDALIAESQGTSSSLVNEENVWRVASDLIRVAQRLQSGELHPKTETVGEGAPF
jgi:hypothetical protein